ncbi:hypothetical protein V1264_008874 [Littorina saxatilis]|uniref:Uncharacterized protein n=1 Tax=Littorina saxatilis TaxID=31220 RepID=A0AAN9AQ76_9CAEN
MLLAVSVCVSIAALFSPENDNKTVVLFAVLGAVGGFLILVIVLVVIHCKRKAGFRLPNRMECHDASRDTPGVQGDQVPSDGDEYHIYSEIPASAHEGAKESHTNLELSNGTDDNDHARPAAATNGEENVNPYDKPGPKESHTYLELSNGTDDKDHARPAAATNGEENANPYDKPGPTESHTYLDLPKQTDDDGYLHPVDYSPETTADKEDNR